MFASARLGFLMACAMVLAGCGSTTKYECCTWDTTGDVGADDPCGFVLNPNCSPDDCKLTDGSTGHCRPSLEGGCACSAGADLCDACNEDADCGPGLRCLDDDGDVATAKVCSRICTLAAMCPAGTVCDPATNICACDHCQRLTQNECIDIPCNDHDPATEGERCIWVVVSDDDPGRCICGPGGPVLSCDMGPCKRDSDCVLWTGGRLDRCVDIGTDGTGRCTVACASPGDCPAPLSLCLDEECVCPCEDPERLTTTLTCTPLHTSAMACVTATAGSLPVCEDTDYDGVGECTAMCHVDRDCPEGMVCDLSYDAGIHWLPDHHGLCVCPALAEHCNPPFNPNCQDDPCILPDGGFGRCVLSENGCYCGETEALCEPCDTDADCAPGLHCLDDDADAATLKVCTVHCGEIGGDVELYACPTGTHCLLTSGDKVCTCDRTPVNLQCGYACESDADCVAWSGGALDACVDIGAGGMGRCTRACSGVADCPVPYAMCVSGQCQCPCDQDVSCEDVHTSSLACGLVTGGVLWQCEDVDMDGDGECTSWCHNDPECPVGMVCDHHLSPALGWGLCVCTGLSDDSPCAPAGNPNCQELRCDDGNPDNYDDRCRLVTVGNETTCKCAGAVGPGTPCVLEEAGTACFRPDRSLGRCVKGNDGMTCEPLAVGLCEVCDTTTPCVAGTLCADDDLLTVTPTVCTKACSVDADCGAHNFCHPVHKLCACDRCREGINDACIAQPCLVPGVPPLPGVCHLEGPECLCAEREPVNEVCPLLHDPLAYCVARSNASNVVNGTHAAFEIPFTMAADLWAWGPAVTTWTPLMAACPGAQWIWRDGASWNMALPNPQCASFTSRFEISNNYPNERCMVLTADDTARVYIDGVARGTHVGPPAGGWSRLTSIDLSDLGEGMHDLKIESCSTTPRFAGLLYNLLVK